MWSIKERIESKKIEGFLPNETMPGVVGKNEDYLYHVFSEEEWNNYLFAPKGSVEQFKDLKVGLFLHIGISAIGAVDLSWPRFTHKLPDRGNGKIADDVYDGWANEFKFENFNPEEWAELAVKMGAKYVIVVAKHHDGFHMWDTKFSDYKITNSPYGKDYIKDLLNALRERNLKIGIYYSQRDWYHKDYQPITNEKFLSCGKKPPYRNKNERLEITEKHKKYINYMKNAVCELVSHYGKIDFFWWDSLWWGGMFEAEMWDAENTERIIRKYQPNIMINNRNSLVGDFDTPETRLGYFQIGRPWETCIPLCSAWGHDGSEPKPLNELISILIGCVCGGGNLLISIGAEKDGKIPVKENQTLLELGDYLKKYSESIYSTRAVFLAPDNSYGVVETNNYYFIHAVHGSNSILINLKNCDINTMTSLTGNDFKIEVVDGRINLSFNNSNELSNIFKIKKV